MKLVAVELKCYKRFEKPITIDLLGDVIAFIGPNEAGKTSILQALLSHEKQEEFSRRERTRHTENSTSVTATYLLEADDHKLLKAVPEARNVKWWTYEKTGERFLFRLEPYPVRNKTTRHRYAKGLNSLISSLDAELLSEVFSDSNGTYDSVKETLNSEEEDLPQVDVDRVRSLGARVLQILSEEAERDEESNVLTQEVKDLLHELSEFDEGLHPHRQAFNLLVSRRPQFHYFGVEERDLHSTYELDDVIDDIPPALKNLAHLARLDLRALLEASTQGDRARREELIDSANATLKTVFSRAWHQSPVTVRVGIQDTTFEVFASLPDRGFTEIGERSEGFLTFVATRAFLATTESARPPILLIDEAETHLHYDAQADLINLFSNLQGVSKIIYTTHSAGCLPRDLGNGVRAVVPGKNEERSTVTNNLWHAGEGGVSPVVFGMGAATFSFLPARSVLMAEGITDAMIYPSLFREVSKRKEMNFQVTPGIAMAGPARLFGLTAEGGMVRFIVDGDGDGDRYRVDLLAQGIPNEHVFSLADLASGVVELEDLIDAKLYVAAVNRVLHLFQNPEAEMSVNDLITPCRTASVEEWCGSHKLRTPSKKDVAQHALDLYSERKRRGKPVSIVDSMHREALARLHSAVVSSFSPSRK